VSQLLLDNMPEPVNPNTGWLYVCVNDHVAKVGSSRTERTLWDRLQAHRKQALMRPVFTHRLADYLAQEAAIKHELRDYLIAGSEWFELRDTYVMRRLVEFMEERGGDTRALRRAFQRTIATDERFHL